MRSLGMLVDRPRGCSPATMKATVLLRQESRPLWNLDEILEILTSAGYQVQSVTIDENTPYQNQVEIWAESDILLSVHGSHLNNQVFMKPGSYLLEIFPANFHHDEQRRAAVSTGVRYIEFRDNVLPTEEQVATKPGFMNTYKKVLALDQEFKTMKECMTSPECR